MAAVALVITDSVSDALVSDFCESDVVAAYLPFIRDGFVYLVGSEAKVMIKKSRGTQVPMTRM